MNEDTTRGKHGMEGKLALQLGDYLFLPCIFVFTATQQKFTDSLMTNYLKKVYKKKKESIHAFNGIM